MQELTIRNLHGQLCQLYHLLLYIAFVQGHLPLLNLNSVKCFLDIQTESRGNLINMQ